jgi:hypothetical protein
MKHFLQIVLQDATRCSKSEITACNLMAIYFTEHGFVKHFLQKLFVSDAKEGIQNLKYHWSVLWSLSIPIDRHVPVFIKVFFVALLEKFFKTYLAICS